MKRIGILAAVCLSLLLTPAAAQKTGEPVKLKYDKFKDRTAVTTGSMHLTAEMDMALFAGHPGTAPPPIGPVLILMNITVVSSNWKYLRVKPELRAIVDGERMSFGEFARHDSSVGRGYVIEYMVARVTPAALMKIAHGKKVEMQFGNAEFEWSPENAGTVRNFLEYFPTK